MKTFNHIGSMLAGAAMITTVVGLTAGLAPAAAAPKQNGATLDIVQDPINAGNYVLMVRGVYPMQPDAQGYINNMKTGTCGEQGFAGMSFGIYGDDGNTQRITDRQFPGVTIDTQGNLWASSRGLEYSRALPVEKRLLDEDRGNDVDEIFVTAHFVDADCGRRDHTSQVVSRRF